MGLNNIFVIGMADFDGLKCGQGKRKSADSASAPCARPNQCRYRTPGMVSSEHTFQTCSDCPQSYPWVNNDRGL